MIKLKKQMSIKKLKSTKLTRQTCDMNHETETTIKKINQNKL
jgi:hypothetical protein